MHKFSAILLVDLPIAEKPVAAAASDRLKKKEPTPKGQLQTCSIIQPSTISPKSSCM